MRQCAHLKLIKSPRSRFKFALVFEGEFLSRSDADAGQLRANFSFFRSGRSRLQCEVEMVEEAGLDRFLVDLGEVDGRGRGLMQIRRERLHFVTVLDLHDVRHVLRVEELGAVRVIR
jgi:hypothetical protein